MKDPRAAVAGFYDLDREPLADLPFYVSRLPSANARVLELGSSWRRWSSPLTMRCYFPDDFARLFSNHGFEIVERCGGYAGEAYGVGPELVVQAKAAPNADRFARWEAD